MFEMVHHRISLPVQLAVDGVSPRLPSPARSENCLVSSQVPSLDFDVAHFG